MPRGRAYAQKRDIYANLLRDTRGLRRDHALARETWFAELELDNKEQTLFSLEMLLKGIVCFENPRNHPGSDPQYAPVSKDYRQELIIVRDVLSSCIVLIRTLLGERDKAFSFFRYLESVIPEDAQRNRLLSDQLAQYTPEESLFLLRQAFSGYVEMMDGILRAGRVSHRAFHAMHQTIAREIGRNTFFNPLIALEFRSEFDRIRHPRILDVLASMESEAAHKVVALIFLSLFRGLRYVGYVELYATSEMQLEHAYVSLAVLRSDLRALSRFLATGSVAAVSNGFERELLSLPALELREFYDDLSKIGHALLQLRDAVTSVSGMLGFEVSRVFEREIPSLATNMEDEERSAALVLATAQLRSVLHHAVRIVCMYLQPEQPPLDLSQDEALRKISGVRLRRDIWMLIQVIRGFIAKAEAIGEDERAWESYHQFAFVQEFIQHFRSIGYQLMRLNDYQRMDPFLQSMKELSRSELMDKNKLRRTLDESRRFRNYLEQLFAEVCRRQDLKDLPFNKYEAARTLRFYIERGHTSPTL